MGRPSMYQRMRFGGGFALKVAHCRKFQNYETVRDVVYQVKICSKNKKHKLRWLASDTNFKLLHIGYPIALALK